MTDDTRIFDRQLLRLRRERAASGFAGYRFLFDEAAGILAERLGDVRRPFFTALDLGCRDGLMARASGAGEKIDFLVQADPALAMVTRAPRPGLVLDEEALPFRANSFDLVVSVLDLHWVNDLPGALIQILRILRPDGLALLALFGAGTLAELRAGLMQAELDGGGRAGVRVPPFLDVRTAGSLLQRAGFALPVVDESSLHVRFANAQRLLADLRGMGETNMLRRGARAPLPRAALRRFLAAAPAPYDCRFSIITMTGWKPHESQPQPRPPGSASGRLADALDAAEHGAGEAALPRRR